MTAPIEPAAIGNSFEFDALREALNYRGAVVREFAPHLRGRVLEVGAGIGQFTALLRQSPGVERLVAIEPERRFCEQLRQSCPGLEVIEGTIDFVDTAVEWDAVVCINVLEHIAEDERELSTYARALKPRRGVLCLFVPAGPGIYAPIDREVGHKRRYVRAELRGKLERARFQVLRLDYFNSVGYVLWWLNFRVLRQRHFNPRSVRLFDRLILPSVHAFESRVQRPPFGQSLIATARAL